MAGNTDKVLLGRTTNHEGKKSEIILLGIFNVVACSGRRFFSEYQLTSQGRKPLPPILDRHDLDKEKIY
ncbi:MAG: hypothetical protein IPP49_15140 [Saprospiraceae bacterium]|nr:hypothetical protein [Saprospiraceae bacterium]